jgi:muramoyltetrapeptide carboxypeptidase
MSDLPLSPGARIGVFSPSGPPDPRGLSAAVELVSAWGYRVVAGRAVLARERYFAGTDAERLADLEWALSDPDLDAAWMSRGGYGLSRLLPRVRWPAVRPRPVLGFSDGTALLAALRRRRIGVPVHAPVLHSLTTHPDEASREAVRRLLAEGSRGEVFTGRTLREGTAEGPLVGGNLAVLASLAGTPEALRARGCIVLLEDVGERPYRLDRLLTQLRQSGGLEGARGIVLGDFVECEDRPDRDGPSLPALLSALEGLDVPILGGIPVGHGPANRPFVVGAPVRLEPGRLRFTGRGRGL